MAKKKTDATSRAKRDEVDSLGFDEAVERLESIIERVESGEIGLEQSLSEYERGMYLIQRCREILGRVEQRVEELSREAREQASPDAAAPNEQDG